MRRSRSTPLLFVLDLMSRSFLLTLIASVANRNPVEHACRQLVDLGIVTYPQLAAKFRNYLSRVLLSLSPLPLHRSMLHESHGGIVRLRRRSRRRCWSLRLPRASKSPRKTRDLSCLSTLLLPPCLSAIPTLSVRLSEDLCEVAHR